MHGWHFYLFASTICAHLYISCRRLSAEFRPAVIKPSELLAAAILPCQEGVASIYIEAQAGDGIDITQQYPAGIYLPTYHACDMLWTKHFYTVRERRQGTLTLHQNTRGVRLLS